MFLQVSWNYIWAFQMQQGRRDGQAVSNIYEREGSFRQTLFCVNVYVCVCVCFALTVVRIEINMYWVNTEPDFIIS